MYRKRTVFLLLVLCISILLPGCRGNNTATPVDKPEPVKEEPQDETKEDPAETVRKRVNPVTVVINNHAAARPHSGLQQASFVYEFTVEGAITRMLAVYDLAEETNFTIGPIRSMRPYFAVQAMEHGGVIANSGYSERTKDTVRKLALKEINNEKYLWRDSARNAPHNLYTDIEKLYKARGASDIKEEAVTSELPSDFAEGREVTITYSSNYKVRYTYNETQDAYDRFINDKPHKDRETGKQYHTTRVIVRKNKHTPVPGTDLVDIDLDGSGDAELYENGKKYAIRWEKKNGKTRYYFQSGTQLNISKGNTWIMVVSKL